MRRFVLLVFALLASFGLAIGQERTVTGLVTDAATGEGLPLVNIQIKGTSTGTVTDNAGRYSVRVPGPEAVLVFFYTGYDSQEVLVADQREINVALGMATEEIEQVVVTAFGTQKKSSLTGAIASVDAAKLEKLPATDAAKALEGQIAGVQISSTTGTPGAGSTIRIRGIGSINSSNAPLIILDGAPYEGDINTINPSDIESYNVLKDAASAALYGARAANGVILITTKSGRKGQTQVNYDGRFGVNMRGIPEYDIITDPKEYYQLEWRSLRNSYFFRGNMTSLAEAGRMASDSLYKQLGGYKLWQEVAPEEWILPDGSINPKLGEVAMKDKGWNDFYNNLFQPRFRHEHTLTVSSANDRTSVFFSAGYLSDKGYAIGSAFERIVARLNVKQQIYDWLEFTNKFQFTKTMQEVGKDGSLGANVFQFTRKLPCIYPIYQHDDQGNVLFDADGKPLFDDGYPATSPDGKVKYSESRMVYKNYNPVLNTRKDLNRYDRYIVAETAGLLFKIPYNFSLSVDFTYNGIFYSSIERMYPFGDAKAVNGRLENNRGNQNSFNFSQVLDWYWDFLRDKSLNLSVKLGHEAYRMKDAWMTGGKENLLLYDIEDLDYAAKYTYLNGAQNNYRVEGYFGQVSLSFRDRYFLQGSYRRDGSSVFHPKHRWGNFWSVGASWVVSREEFFKPVHQYINNLKLRLSYGLQGNDFLYQGRYRAYTPYMTTYTLGSDGKKAQLTPAYVGNEMITWEKNYNLSLALEFGLFNNLVGGQLEFFSRTTRDMLFRLPIQVSSGFSTRPVNFGDVRNLGVELQLNVNPLRTEHMGLTISTNLTHYKNTLLKLPDNYAKEGMANDSKRYVIGHSLEEWYLVHYEGIDKSNGAPLYRFREKKDSGEWVVTPLDQEKAGWSQVLGRSSLPDVTGGFGVMFDAYGADLSVQFSYAIGGYVMDDTYAGLMSVSGLGASIHQDQRDAWSPENRDGRFPRMEFHSSLTTGSDRNLVTASHLAFKSVVVGYSFPQKWVNVLKMQQLRIYFMCDNVWLWSARKGFDPRQSIFGGEDYAYAPLRTIAGGVQIRF